MGEVSPLWVEAEVAGGIAIGESADNPGSAPFTAMVRMAARRKRQ